MTGRLWWAALYAALVVACTATTPPQPTGEALVPITPGPAGQSVAPTSAGASPVASSASVTVAQTSACSLLYNAEVSSALGVSIEANQEEQANGSGAVWMSDCAYWRHQFQDEAPLDVGLAAGDLYTSAYSDLATETDTTPLPGIGDAATLRMTPIAGLDQPVGALFVRIGNAVLSLSLGIVDIGDGGALIQVGDAAAQQKALVDLAGIAIGRLTQPQTPEAKTCDLLSIADASTLLGVALVSADDVDDHDVYGPSCRYKGANGHYAFYVAVNATQAARDNFTACQAGGNTVLGVGDEAFEGRGDCRIIKLGFDYIQGPLYVRSGATVVVVGLNANLSTDAATTVMTGTVRQLLPKLGLNAGATPPPVSGDALEHPCALVGDADVASILGAAISSHHEWSASTDAGVAMCMYSTDQSNIVPLTMKLTQGADAVSGFSRYSQDNSGRLTAVAGVGDAAFSEQVPGGADQPYVTLHIRSGDVVVDLALGPIKPSSDFLSFVAAGTPDQQLQMLRQLAAIILPRLHPPGG